MHVVYEAVACITLKRGQAKVSLTRGARLKVDLARHDFDDRQLRRAIDDGKLRPLPLGAVAR
jgi:hypothetical protein